MGGGRHSKKGRVRYFPRTHSMKQGNRRENLHNRGANIVNSLEGHKW